MPFRLHVAVVSFQRIMDKSLKGVKECAMAYIDDSFVFSPTWVEHLAHLRRVLQALHQARLMANQKKSHIGCTSVQYLGFWIEQGRIWVVPNKVEALAEAELPQTRKTSQSLLGLANWFVPSFATLSAPFMDMLKGEGKELKPMGWSLGALTAFQQLKEALCWYSTLYAPLPNHPFVQYTNTSLVGLGAMLAQKMANGEHPIFFLCCKLMALELNYAVIEK